LTELSVEIRSLRRDELEQWFDHVSGVFDDTPRQHLEDHWFQDPWRDLSSILVAVEDDKIVSTVRVFWRDAWVNGLPLPFGGIGEVSTHPSYRRRGGLLQAGITPVEGTTDEVEAMTLGLCRTMWGGPHPGDEAALQGPGKHLLWTADSF